MTQRAFYRLTVGAAITGFAWLGLAVHSGEQVSVCLIRSASGVPCPSCGSTRAVLSLMEGDLMQALWWNPLGLLLAVVMCILPPWLAVDVMSGRKTMWQFFQRVEQIVSRKAVAIPLIVATLANWIWNIIKLV